MDALLGVACGDAPGGDVLEVDMRILRTGGLVGSIVVV